MNRLSNFAIQLILALFGFTDAIRTVKRHFKTAGAERVLQVIFLAQFLNREDFTTS